VGDAFCENLFCYPGTVWLTLGKIDHGFFGATQVERGSSLFHCLSDRFDISIGILIEELKEEGKICRIALVRRRGQEEQVVSRIPK